MDKAKAAVGNFMAKAGHHDTTVHERVAPAVTQETLNRTRVEEKQMAIDREVHQHHYHTSVQPIVDREILPEKHHHRMIDVEERTHNHNDEGAVRARLEQERAQFADRRVEGKERVVSTEAPVIAGEHIHHHVHETIQPIVQKETIQPSVVHTTIPIHEVHHNEAKHHAASALPAVSMSEFRAQGGSLSGREERVDGFEGEPKPVASTLGGAASGLGATGARGTTASGVNGTRNSRLENEVDPRVDSTLDGSRTVGNRGVNANGYDNATGVTDSRHNNSNGVTGASGVNSEYGTGNPGKASKLNKTGVSGAGPHNSRLENKIDPRVDSNEDGKAGVGK
ncbi:MAG: hypothetical protein M1838_002284 [Thelocarpon superellum]|nr:MAG: hypothetical protein M1838_002284 [Thelocarpon superellum]